MVDRTGAGGTTSGTDIYYYYLKDALGSAGSLTNASGAEVELYTYSPYGKTTIYNASGTEIGESAYGNPFAWTSQRYDVTNGMYHFWARSYWPVVGRWLQEDKLGVLSVATHRPAVAEGQHPYVLCLKLEASEEYRDGHNLFLYVAAAPITNTDPWGLFSLGNVLGATSVRVSLSALNATSMFAGGVNFIDKVLYGVGLRQALIDCVIVTGQVKLGQ